MKAAGTVQPGSIDGREQWTKGENQTNKRKGVLLPLLFCGILSQKAQIQIVCSHIVTN
jgi:hypothetical protein